MLVKKLSCFWHHLIISTLISLPSQGQSKATAAAHLNLISAPSCLSCLLDVSFLLPCAGCMVSKGPQNKSEAFLCAPMACLSFQMEIEGHVYPWGVSGDQGASVAPAAPGASVFPLRGSWTVTHTKHRVHHKCLCPAAGCLVHAVVGKAP